MSDDAGDVWGKLANRTLMITFERQGMRGGDITRRHSGRTIRLGHILALCNSSVRTEPLSIIFNLNNLIYIYLQINLLARFARYSKAGHDHGIQTR